MSLCEDINPGLRAIADTVEALCAHDDAEREWADLSVALLETIEDEPSVVEVTGFDKILDAIHALAQTRLAELTGDD